MGNGVMNIKICGKEDSSFSNEIASLVHQKITQRIYSENDVKYIKLLEMKLVDGGLNVSEKDLERLRTLCKLWDVELKPAEITSHRPIVGHIIVAIKKALFPIIRVFLRDTFKQQRDFNAASVSMLAELLNKKHKADSSIS